MAVIPTKVELFYDVVSPYTWFSFEVLCRYRKHWNMDLVLRPFFLGGVMKASGNKPPMTVAAKGMYMEKDLRRNSEYFGINLKFVEDPYKVLVQQGSLRAMRFITAVSHQYPEHTENVSRELWIKIWSKGEDIVEDESLKSAAEKANMSEIQIIQCLKSMDSPEIRDALKKTTDEAVEYGAFGAPIVVVHTNSGPEMFFGSDRFPLIAQIMNETWKGPFPDPKSTL